LKNSYKNRRKGQCQTRFITVEKRAKVTTAKYVLLLLPPRICNCFLLQILQFCGGGAKIFFAPGRKVLYLKYSTDHPSN